MALTAEKPPSPWRGPLHLLSVFVLAAGLVVGVLGALESDRDGQLTREYFDQAWDSVSTGFGMPPERGPWFLVAGVAAAFFALLFEVVVFLPWAAQRYRMLGLPVVLRCLLLYLLLLLGVAGVVVGAFVAFVRLGDFHPHALPVALACPFLTVRSLESRRWR
jgi:hypothetical protein